MLNSNDPNQTSNKDTSAFEIAQPDITQANINKSTGTKGRKKRKVTSGIDSSEKQHTGSKGPSDQDTKITVEKDEKEIPPITPAPVIEQMENGTDISREEVINRNQSRLEGLEEALSKMTEMFQQSALDVLRYAKNGEEESEVLICLSESQFQIRRTNAHWTAEAVHLLRLAIERHNENEHLIVALEQKVELLGAQVNHLCKNLVKANKRLLAQRVLIDQMLEGEDESNHQGDSVHVKVEDSE